MNSFANEKTKSSGLNLENDSETFCPDKRKWMIWTFIMRSTVVLTNWSVNDFMNGYEIFVFTLKFDICLYRGCENELSFIWENEMEWFWIK